MPCGTRGIVCVVATANMFIWLNAFFYRLSCATTVGPCDPFTAWRFRVWRCSRAGAGACGDGGQMGTCDADGGQTGGCGGVDRANAADGANAADEPTVGAAKVAGADWANDAGPDVGNVVATDGALNGRALAGGATVAYGGGGWRAPECSARTAMA